jgi:drug/metabolite transporter (DMT)-like permease
LPPRLLLIIAAVLFSTGGAAIKYNSLTGWQVACWRSIIAAAALWIALPAVRRRWTIPLFGVGCVYAAMLILFVSATKLTTAANAIFLQSTAPLYLLFIGPVLLKEPLRRSDWLLMAAMGVGMSLFFVSTEDAVASAPNPALGNILAVFSGVAWALVVAGLRWLARDGADPHAAISTVFAGNVIAFVVAFGPALPLPSPQLPDVLAMLYLGTCQIALAYVCLAKAMRHVPAFEASAIILVEPALNPVWTWLVLGERPGSLPIIGGAILLSATAVNGWWQNRGRAMPVHTPAK